LAGYSIIADDLAATAAAVQLGARPGNAVLILGDTLSVVVVTGAGGTFCSGMDLTAWGRGEGEPSTSWPTVELVSPTVSR